MGPTRLLAVLGALSFIAACEAKSPPGAQSTSEDRLVARTKAQLGIDGGASTSSAPSTIATTETVTSTQTQSATSTYTVSATGNATDTANVYYFSWTKTGTATATANRTATVTTNNISIGTKSAVATMTVTNPYGGSQTKTVTGNVTVSGTLTGASSTKVLTVTATSTNPTTGTKTHTYAGTASQTFTATGSNTGTGTQSWTYTLTQTGTQTGTASNVCSGTWAFCDNFEIGNGGGWNVRQGPVQNFSVQADGTKVYSQSDFAAAQLYISQAGSAWMDSTVEANLKPTHFSTNSSAAMVTLWGHYDSTWGADCGYYVALRGDGKVALGKRVAGVDSALGAPVAVSGGIAAGTWYDVKMEFVGSTIKASVGGTLLLTQSDTSCDAGSIGVGSVGASFEADDVRVVAPATNTCVQDWRNTTCGAFCTYEAGVQSDRVGCGAYLDCYATNGCSPETCGGPDDVCGVNRLNPWGNASKEVADQVYKCMGCAGSVDCSKAKYYNGTVCADGNPCTWGDTCQNGVCAPDPNRNTPCKASDQCHDVGICSPTTGICSDPAKEDGARCDDGNACTKTDECQSGVCRGNDPVICTALDQCHVVGKCDETTGECSHPNKADGEECSDGNACTKTDSCDGGICKGNNPVTCTALDQCHVSGTCDETTGECSNPNKEDETGCNDGNACTTADACHGGVCVGIGSGYIGPGEQCAPATPKTPGPFGQFHCLLEEVPGTTKNILRLGSGPSSQTWIVRGTMDFAFNSGGATLTNLSATGQRVRLSQQDVIILTLQPRTTATGTVDTTSGNLQVNLPVLVSRANGEKTSLALTLAGQIGDRVFQGAATDSDDPSAQAQIFCREQFMNTMASVTFQFDQAGRFVGQGPIDILGGTPTMPKARSIAKAGDLLIEMVSVTGEILDQYGIGQPWTETLADATAPAPAGDPSAPVDVVLRIPLSNRVGSVALRTITGEGLATADLTASINSFCDGVGSQFCDYRVDDPIRDVLYDELSPGPALNPAFPSGMLPGSSRLAENEVVLTSDADARQPDVALDADGNAIVVWRENYDKVMAIGISRDGDTLFGPVKVNNKNCVTGWVPGKTPPIQILEFGQSVSSRPVVSVSNTARDGAGNADRTFAVAWGGWAELTWSNGAFVETGFLCSRLMKGDGTPLSDPVEIVPAPNPDQSNVTIPMDGYISLAMTESHEYVATWHEYVESAARYRISARRFGADGLPKSATATVISDDTSKNAAYPSVAMDKTGRAVITWLRMDDPDPNVITATGHIRLQRLDSAFSKVGSPLTVGTSTLVAEIPAVALRSDNGNILVSAGSKDGDIYTAGFRFADGTAFDAWSRMNSRTMDSQRRPAMAVAASGGYIIAWMDHAGSDPNAISPITAQVYNSGGVPLDIDFTASTQTAIYTDNVAENPDFFLGDVAFAFRAAASKDDYVLVWQRPTTGSYPDYEGGIVMQRISGAKVDCPKGEQCGSAIPLRITGATKDKIDVILSPGAVIRDDTGQIDPSFTKLYTSEVEFGRKAVDLIVNGYLKNSVFARGIDEFNFYYDMTQGIQHAVYTGGECQGFAGRSGFGLTSLNKSIGFNGNQSFANVAGVVFKSYDNRACGVQDHGVASSRHPGDASYDARTGFMTSFWIQNAEDYSTMIHESGHATFGLREEYCIGGASQDTTFHSNSFDTENECKLHSVASSTCRVFTGCTAFWKADPDDDAMNQGGGTQFGPDCQRRSECVLGKFEGDCSR